MSFKSFLLALLLAVTLTFSLSAATYAQGRMRQVGGYGLIVQNSPTFAYGSLDSAVNGRVNTGEIVYLNGWQIGVYHIGTLRWVAETSVQPIIDSSGRPMVNFVSKRGNQYYMNGNRLTLPRYVTEAEKFLANPDINAPIIYNGSKVPSDVSTDLVDTSKVWFGSPQSVVATMRVTNLYNFIYLRTGPSANAPQARITADAGEVLTAYEVQGDWYRIGPNLWAPRTWGNDVLMVPENVEAYAQPQYDNGGKWISIDLNRQQLTAWEGNEAVLTTRVKTGKYGYYTPAGVWRTFDKIPNERMVGSDYDLMDVSWTQYFTLSGIGIHSAYWHNNYNGRPGSHGCVNTPPEMAKRLFMWAPLGITVVTHNPYIFDAQDIADANKWSQYER